MTAIALLQGVGGNAAAILGNVLPIVAIGLVFYFIVIAPANKQRKKTAEMLSSLKKGDRVLTTSGIYGQITRVNDKSVQVQIADKVRIEVARASVGGYQGQDPVVTESGSSSS